MKKIFLIIPLIVFGFLFVANAKAACAPGHIDNGDGTCTATLQSGGKDTFLNEYAPTSNVGSDTRVVIRSAPSGGVKNIRSILEFDISTLPAGATLISATSSLYDYSHDNGAPQGRTYWMDKLTRANWIETQATWNVYSTSNNWTTVGGDYVTSNPAGASAIVPVAGNWINWNVLAIIQDAYDLGNPAEFLVRDGTEYSATTQQVSFYSKEYITVSLRPKLVVTYTPLAGSSLVEFAEDTILDLTGLTETTYISAGSKADSLVINGADLRVNQILAAPDFFSLKTATHPILKLTPSGGTVDLNLSSSNFSSGYIYQWTEESSISVEHVVGVPDEDTFYSVTVDGLPYGIFNSGALAEITFTRTGNGSPEVFVVGGVAACQTHNVWGWAWSENIGWISFSCKDTASPVDYGVDIQPGTYAFSGYAWSENIGWVSFNRADTGAPPGKPDFGTHLAEVAILTGEVSGWARALAYGDGWSGWIKLRGPVIADTGLVASWSMDEGSGNQIFDASGNNNTGTLKNMNPSQDWVQGKYGTALDFDGTNDYVDAGTNPSILDLTDFSLGFWVRFADLASNRGLWSWDVGNVEIGYYAKTNGQVQWYGHTSAGFIYVSTGAGAVQTNTWHYIVLNWDADATAKIYVDGVEKGSTNSPGTVDPINWDGFQLSRSGVAAGAGTLRHKGEMDEVRFYNRALSAEEILAHYNGYGVDINKSTGDFSNYSWSDMVLGWVSFNSVDTGSPYAYKVQTSFDFNRAPQIQNSSYSSPTTCSFEMSIPIFSWDYYDEDNVMPPGADPQAAYQIRIDNDSTFEVDANNDPVLDGDEYRCSGSLCEATTSADSFSPQPAEWIAWTGYGQTYYWRARVKDSGGKWSSWSSVLSFSTQAHPYSEPNFDYDPDIIVLNKDVNFTDLSVCYDASEASYSCKNNAVNSYAWDFNNDAVVDSTTRGNVVYKYTTTGSYAAVLKITDDVGACDFQVPVPLDVLAPLPEYKEISPPTSYFRGLFANVLQFFKDFIFS